MTVMQTILAIFKFWDQVTWFVKKLVDTPAESHEKLVIKIGEQSHSFAKSGRPKWD